MNCEYCNEEHDGLFGSGRFCNIKCSNGFSTKNKRKEINAKISKTLKNKFVELKYIYNCEKCSIEFNTNRKLRVQRKIHCADCKRKTNKIDINNLNSIYQLSTRTISKIFKRLNLGCSNCGWNESSCDLHHINGRKIENFNDHKNLCYLCPNCHRLVHTKKLNIEKLINLQIYIGDKWKEFYMI